MSEPIICTLSPDAIQSARDGLLPGLIDLATSVEPTADGYRLTFDPSSEALTRIARAIDAERRCCQWLRFDLAVPSSGAPFVLTLRGPDGAREFLAALFIDTAGGPQNGARAAVGL